MAKIGQCRKISGRLEISGSTAEPSSHYETKYLAGDKLSYVVPDRISLDTNYSTLSILACFNKELMTSMAIWPHTAQEHRQGPQNLGSRQSW